MGEVTFRRSVKPEGVTGLPSLVGYHDGSKVAFGCSVYIRWRLDEPTGRQIIGRDGEIKEELYFSQLLAAKSKIAKTGKVPRNEMNSLILLSRLLTATLRGLVDKPTSFLIIGDSKCTIQSIEAESKILKDFFNNRCEEWGEHKRHWVTQGIDVEPLHHTASSDNVADLATRGEVSYSQVDENSEWQNGPDYLMYERDSSWPINRDMLKGQDAIPDEEKLVRVYSVVEADRLKFNSIR